MLSAGMGAGGMGEVEVRRGDQLHATDGWIGSVERLVIDPEDHHVTHALGRSRGAAAGEPQPRSVTPLRWGYGLADEPARGCASPSSSGRRLSDDLSMNPPS